MVRMGVCIHSTDPKKVQALKGFGSLRLDLFHSVVSRRYGMFDYSAYDPWYRACLASGVKPLFVLFLENPNIWQGAGRYVPDDAKALKIVEDFCCQTARQYPKAEWEVVNEPNWAKSMKGFAWTPTHYARVAKAALQGIRAVSKERVWLGALANEAGSDQPDVAFLQKMLMDASMGGGDLWRCLDENTGLSFHPYTQDIPERQYRYTDLVRFHSAEMVLVDKEYPIAYTEWGYRDAWCSALGVDKGMMLKRILDVGEQDGVPIWLYSWDDPTGEGFGIEGVRIPV